jgi:hypothetical protein
VEAQGAEEAFPGDGLEPGTDVYDLDAADRRRAALRLHRLFAIGCGGTDVDVGRPVRVGLDCARLAPEAGHGWSVWSIERVWLPHRITDQGRLSGMLGASVIR